MCSDLRVVKRCSGWGRAVVVGWVPFLAVFACGEPPFAGPPATDLETAWVQIADELFELDLAIQPRNRLRGLSGRRFVPRHGGMLFVYPRLDSLGMVMRHCPIPLDVAFLDVEGRVVTIRSMTVEPPRGREESVEAYERRLPIYRSEAPARFAVETAGGRLSELGLAVGDLLVFDVEDLLRRAK